MLTSSSAPCSSASARRQARTGGLPGAPLSRKAPCAWGACCDPRSPLTCLGSPLWPAGALPQSSGPLRVERMCPRTRASPPAPSLASALLLLKLHPAPRRAGGPQVGSGPLEDGFPRSHGPWARAKPRAQACWQPVGNRGASGPATLLPASRAHPVNAAQDGPDPASRHLARRRSCLCQLVPPHPRPGPWCWRAAGAACCRGKMGRALEATRRRWFPGSRSIILWLGPASLGPSPAWGRSSGEVPGLPAPRTSQGGL